MAAVGKCPYIVRVLGACLEPPHLALIQVWVHAERGAVWVGDATLH